VSIRPMGNNYHARCASRAGDSRWRIQDRNILFIVEDVEVFRFRFETTLVFSIPRSNPF